jgi:hypothetical protein
MRLSGDVATLQIRISMPDDRFALERIEERRREMIAAVGGIVREELGSEFYLREMVVTRGSVIVTIVLAAANALIFANDLASALERVRTALHGFFRGAMSSEPLTISSSWIAGPALGGAMASSDGVGRVSPGEPAGLLLRYIVLSHAIMLGFILWMLLRRTP